VRVSIIIPVFNEAKIVPGLLDSLRGLPAEIIFVDGDSTDDTAGLVRASGFRCLSAPRGRATQMNAGAAAARGDVLLFQHADTVMPQGFLHTVRRAIDAGAVGGSFDLRLDTSRPLLRLVGLMITLRSRLTGVSTGDQGMFVTRAAFDELGGYAEQPLFEDVDMSVRLGRVGKTCRLRPPALTSPRRWEHGGTIRTVLRMWVLRALYYGGVSVERLARHYGAAR